MNDTYLIAALILLPLLGGICEIFAFLPRISAKVAATLSLLCTLALIWQFDFTRADEWQMLCEGNFLGTFDEALKMTFAIDGFALLMLLLSNLTLFAAVWVFDFSKNFAKKSQDGKVARACLLFIGVGANGAFASQNLLWFFAFHELALIPSFLMLGIYGIDERKRASWLMLIYLGLGGLLVLGGIIMLANAYGDVWQIRELYRLLAAGDVPSGSEQKLIFIILLIGFGALASLFPLHSWAMPVYSRSPAPMAMMHAGVLKKFALFGLARIAWPLLPAGAEHWQNLVLILATANILYLGYVCLSRRSLDEMLANSSIMHMGYIFLGLAIAGTGAELAYRGAILLMFAHGLSIALLFAVIGIMRERCGGVEYDFLGGVASKAPRLGLLFGVGAFAALGLPGLANFAGELLIFLGAFADFEFGKDSFNLTQIACLIAIFATLISSLYTLRALRINFFGKEGVDVGGIIDEKFPRLAPLYMLALALIFFGVAPRLPLSFVGQKAQSNSSALPNIQEEKIAQISTKPDLSISK